MTEIYTPDFNADIESEITWQFDNSDAVKTLIYGKHDFYKENVTDFFNDWYRDVFNLDTANYFGLIVWAIILGCTEYIEITQKISKNTIGFSDTHKNFHESNFALSNYIYTLKIEQLRKVLKAQMYNFNSTGSIYDINKLLAFIFPDNNPYITVDGKVITIHFPIALDDDDLSIVTFSNMLPLPVGCKRLIDNGNGE